MVNLISGITQTGWMDTANIPSGFFYGFDYGLIGFIFLG